MKKIIFIASLIFVLAIGVCYSTPIFQTTKKEVFMNKKVLVTYFSWSGNTEFVAKKIQQKTNGDIFEIKPVKEYPKNYNETVELAKEEIQKNIPVQIEGKIDLTPYDVIFIGTPAWWYTMAPAVKTFILENNFDNKVIVPFITHGGGGKYSIKEEMQAYSKNATVKNPLVVPDRGGINLDKQIDNWLLEIN